MEATPSFSERFARIPPRLVAKVNGVETEDGFTYIGGRIADDIQAAVPDIGQRRDILDFGCGLGRVALQLRSRFPSSVIDGCDIDPLMLKWAAVLLQDKNVALHSGTHGFAGESFDLVVAISVFTHLDVTVDYWLSELHRLLRPGARAFLTYHDDTLFAEMAAQGAFPGIAPGHRLDARYVLGLGGPEGGATMGKFYTTESWNALLSRWFEIDSTVPRGLCGHQSYSVIRKRPVVIDRERMYREYARSLEQQLFELRQAHAVEY
jgi:SAM-dependent methyltransferase